MAECSKDSFNTNMNMNSSIFDEHDSVFAQLIDMFGDTVVPEIIYNICTAYHWELDKCMEQLIQYIEDNGSFHQELIKVENIESNLSLDSNKVNETETSLNTTFTISGIKSTSTAIQSSSSSDDQVDGIMMETEKTVSTDHNKKMYNSEDIENQKIVETKKNLGAIPKTRQKMPENAPEQHSINFNSFLETIPKEFTTNSLKVSKNLLYFNSEFEKIIEYIRIGYKVMIIMRGAPGSGKTYLARNLVDKTIKEEYTNFIFSTDDYFYDIYGRYIYKSENLEDAHQFIQNRVKEKAANGWSPIIIDNTNIEIWEMSPYVQIAVQYGYCIAILKPNNSWNNCASKLVLKNNHGLPKKKIQIMLENFQPVTVKELLMINNIRYDMKMPQLRNKPPIPKEAIFNDRTIDLDN